METRTLLIVNCDGSLEQFRFSDNESLLDDFLKTIKDEECRLVRFNAERQSFEVFDCTAGDFYSVDNVEDEQVKEKGEPLGLKFKSALFFTPLDYPSPFNKI